MSRAAKWTFALGFLLVCGAASAQDMTFSVEETGQPPAPPAEGPPSEALANALRLYQGERYQEAAVQLQRVVEGETQDAPANVQKAQFFLGKALYHLGFYQSALSIFDEITQQGQGHLFFDQTLQWLAQLATQLPDPAGIVEKLGRYGVEKLQQFDTAETRGIYNQLLFLMGRSKYGQGEFEVAIDLFSRVADRSPYYVRAKFFEGISYVRLRRARPAIQSFRAILDVIESGKARGVEDEDRMRNLAWISLARVYYTASNKTNEAGEIETNGQLLGQAVEAWNQVEQSSEYWLDAVFESSWAFFLADEYARALGNVHTLFSPYFQDAYYPEALVLKAVVFFSNCQWDNAAAVVQQFHERYDAVKKELEEVLAQFEGDNTKFFEFLKAVREERAALSPRIRAIVSSALSDRSVLRHLEYVRILDEEEGRLQRMPAEFQNSSLGARIAQDVALSKSFAIDQTGDLVRSRYERLIRELQDLMNQIDAVELEITTAMRGELSERAAAQTAAAAQSRGGDVKVDEEHQLWPFDGEYWRDELGYYRQQVTNVCGR